ncbi:MAG TPA: hypothetical protein PLC09_08225 [Holophaga sp.]|nr:hypothetical protein [Holophaga sp.]
MPNILRINTFFLVLVGAIYNLNGQIAPTPSRPFGWKNGELVKTDRNGFTILSLASDKEQSIKAPPQSIDLIFINGIFWATQWDSEGHRILISCSEDGQAWELQGIYHQTSLKNGKNRPVRLYVCPLGEGRFLLADASGAGIQHGKDRYPLVAARVDERKNLKITRAIDLGIDPAEPWPVWVYSTFTLGTPFIVANERTYVCSYRTGQFWEITANGSVRRHIRLFSELDDKRIQDSGSHDWAILQAHPNREGDIIIATLPKPLVLDAQKIYPRRYEKATLLGTDSADLETIDQRVLAAFQGVEWWRLDTETGKIVLEATPESSPRRFRNTDQVRAFAFSYGRDGRPVVTKPSSESAPSPAVRKLTAPTDKRLP